MKDRIEFFAKHSPSHNPVAGDGLSGKVDMITVDVDLSTPQDGSVLFKDFHNAKHFLINSRVL